MHFEYLPTRSGEQTVLVEGRLLHSRYDPRREAQRFIDTVSLEYPRGTAVLIGDGTGIVSRELQKRHPSLRVIGLRPSPEGVSLDGTMPAIPLGNLEQALRNSLHPLEVTTIQVISWPGARTAIPLWMEQTEHFVLAVFRALQAELATTASFGRLWLTNALRRTLLEKRRSSLHFQGESLLVAAAGPSLDQARRFIPHQARETTPVIAASSATLGLSSFGFSPAVNLHSDGGFWASRYTRTGSDLSGGASIPVLALPLRASPCASSRRSSSDSHGPFLYRTGWVGEELASDSFRWPFLQDQPTVGASLLALANLLAPQAHLILAGLDLCSRDLLNHARPHWNDRYLALTSDRLAPQETLRFQRLGPPDQIRPLQWQDGVRGWQNRTLALYREPVLEMINTHRKTGSVSFLSPSPAWADERPLPSGTTPPRGSFSLRSEERHPFHQRVQEAQQRIMMWHDELREPPPESPGSHDRSSRERLLSLLLHLAPIETIQWYRGSSSWETSAASTREALEKLLKLVGAFSP
ncbi:hypothetical protein SAMN05920897_1154 [Alkalispirochaeta americana]|uniref:DUF115 domain-containing protein n=1 Tax=Alkalispirochaeta americana TaxID=159291 RepID=A0A1N6VKI6_9SPIO|nr:hypothetical protein [Alkalispirochaeta americana]SIQ78350.1 hypothetical protein SAMN05920897_1154 [Alkalispirochaeta americana]